MIARILIWNLFDSKTSLDEVRVHLPELPDGDRWLSNEPLERLGLVTFGDELPDFGGCPVPGTSLSPLGCVARTTGAWHRRSIKIPELVGREPDIAEEFDVE